LNKENPSRFSNPYESLLKKKILDVVRLEP
jgi:hypothetical protein